MTPYINVDHIKQFSAGFLQLHCGDVQLLRAAAELMCDLVSGELDPLEEYATAALLLDMICPPELAA